MLSRFFFALASCKLLDESACSILLQIDGLQCLLHEFLMEDFQPWTSSIDPQFFQVQRFQHIRALGYGFFCGGFFNIGKYLCFQTKVKKKFVALLNLTSCLAEAEEAAEEDNCGLELFEGQNGMLLPRL